MAKTLANYDPLVQIPSGMTPAGADFPIVESHDILVGENDKRLDAKLDDIDSAIGNVGQTPIATQLSSKVNTGDIVTSVAATGSTSNNKIPSETAVRAAIEAKTINVDTTVTQGSTNAVSGGAVHTQLATKQDTLTFDTTPTASSSNPVTSGGVKTALDAKQDALTFDTTPTASSSNPVTSGGVKAALDNKQNTLTYETTPIAGSVNPVTSTGIRNAIDAAAAGNLGAMQAQYTEFVADAEDVLDRAASLSNGMVACSNIAAETTVGDTRILLYTGTTNANYTNGHWYYNSAPSNAAPSWTDGGAVGSAPTIDNTLTTAGAAADSKSVGDAIENIVTISNTQPGANSGNKVWIKETTNEEVQVPTYAEHIAKANKADIATNNESDNGSGTISASKAYAIGDHFYINNTNTSSENYGVSTLYKATAAIASGSAIVVGTNCEASKVVDELTSLSNDIDTVKADLGDINGSLSTTVTDNIFDNLTFTSGYMSKAGTTSSSQTLEYSSVISVSPGDILISNHSFRFVCALKDGVANSELGAENTSTYTVPNNINEVVVTIYASTEASDAVKHTHAALIDVDGLQNDVDGLRRTVVQTLLSTFGYFTSTTLIYWNKTARQVIYFKCKPYTEYTITKNVPTTSFDIAYVKTKPQKDVEQPVYGYVKPQTTSIIYTTGADAAYLLIHCGENIVNPVTTDKFVITDEEVVTVDDTARTIITYEDAYLPSDMYLIKDKDYEIYHGQICQKAENYTFKWSAGANLGNRVRLNYNATGNSTLTCIIFNADGTLAKTLITTVHVVEVTSDAISLLPLGDSLTNHCVWESELMNMANNITCVGARSRTVKDSDNDDRVVYNEGRAGFTSFDYTSGSAYGTNPSDSGGLESPNNRWYDPVSEKFSASYYFTNNFPSGQTQPNMMTVFLGMNDLLGTKTVTEIVANIKDIIDNILTYDSNMLIVLIAPQLRWMGSLSTSEQRLFIEYSQKMEDMASAYNNMIFVPLLVGMDSSNNYATNNVTINTRSALTEQVASDITHPAKQGYWQIADYVLGAVSYLDSI